MRVLNIHENIMCNWCTQIGRIWKSKSTFEWSQWDLWIYLRGWFQWLLSMNRKKDLWLNIGFGTNEMILHFVRLPLYVISIFIVNAVNLKRIFGALVCFVVLESSKFVDWNQKILNSINSTLPVRISLCRSNSKGKS